MRLSASHVSTLFLCIVLVLASQDEIVQNMLLSEWEAVACNEQTAIPSSKLALRPSWYGTKFLLSNNS